MLREFFVAIYEAFENKGYFQERLGINCVDGYINGSVGDVVLYSFRKLRRKGLFPILSRKDDFTEDEIFDLIEFLYDHVSQPIPSSGHYHSWNQCGHHYSEFIQGSAQDEFRDEINDLLRDYNEGYELSRKGEILSLPGGSLEPLLQAAVPAYDPSNVSARVEAAVEKFRRRKSSIEDRRDAIRDLADVLEHLRPQLKNVLRSQDEADLFNIANNFGIRHHNARQKIDYDRLIWLSWIFYFYLATIHAAVRLVQKSEETSSRS
ncbi:hypothetical protein [Synechococcus sp. ATX 2A4]|uniref:hypothetical protein n=1 Tax=Synechococcus sp. ATX 2A4 TaxID=2823727 RepID=UPI0020CDD440|nr:hypothetical protein [Synechococcus sp. ATX 2A4]